MALQLGMLGPGLGLNRQLRQWQNWPFDDTDWVQLQQMYNMGYIDGHTHAALMQLAGLNGLGGLGALGGMGALGGLGGLGGRRGGRNPRGRWNVRMGYRWGEDFAAVNPMMLGMGGLGGGLGGLDGLGVGYDAAILGNQHYLLPAMGAGRLWM